MDDVIGPCIGVEAQPASIAAANDAVIMKRIELPPQNLTLELSGGEAGRLDDWLGCLSHRSP